MFREKLRYPITLTLCALTLLFLGGCGDDLDEHHEDMHGETAPDTHAHEGEAAHGDTVSPAAMADPDARTISVVATDFAFQPADITAAPGEKLHIKMKNEGRTMHMWEVEGVSGTHIHAPMGESGSVTFTAPEEPGEYKIYCATAGHEKKGMVGTLTIRGS